jgi:ELWxxDGT repeat protein
MFRHTFARLPRIAALLALNLALISVPPGARADEGAPSMTQDLNTLNIGSEPRDLIAVGQTLFLTATTSAEGRELWRSDGTQAGTVLVKDINPGAGGGLSTYGSTFVAMDGALFFLATDNESRWGLWRSDGSEEGTRLLKDVAFGAVLRQAPMVAVDGRLFFIVADGSTDQLWMSDGTPEGTTLLKELALGAYTSEMLGLNGTLFLLNSGAAGVLWRSDGTSAGTLRIGGPEYGSGLLAVNNTLFFGGDGIDGPELWASDGTAAGTRPLKAFERGKSMYSSLTRFGDKLLFGVTLLSEGSSALWQSDGTQAGTVPVREFPIASQAQQLSALTVFSTTLYFFVAGGLWRSDGTSAGTSLISSLPVDWTAKLAVVDTTLVFIAAGGLWRSDGTPSGTWLITSLPSSSTPSSPRLLANANGMLFFMAGDDATGDELWRSDGTVAGTMLVAEINPGPASPFHSLAWDARLPYINGALFLPADDGKVGTELWSSDGSAQGTRLVKDLAGASGGSSMPTRLTRLGDRLFFIADDGVHGRELWTSDGESLDTRLFKDIYPGPKSAFVDDTLIDLNGALYFTANDGQHGFELWRSDGTPDGTTLLRDVQPGANGAYPRLLTATGSALYFTRNGQFAELWRSDGTGAGTRLVRRFDYSTHLGCMAGIGERLFTCLQYTSSQTALLRLELWISDGTPEATTLLAHLEYPSSDSSPRSLVDIYGTLFFGLPDALWASDGTPQSTRLIKGIAASELSNINGRLVFAGDDGSSGRELWTSAGTLASTRRVADINPGPNSARPANFTRLDARTFLFSATTEAEGTELWRSDGTPAGTVLVRDLNPGTASSLPHNLQPVRLIVDGHMVNMVYFSANDGTSGDELWQTDGTAAGTRRVRDINPGKSSSGPAQLAVQAQRLFFTADDGLHGREPWSMPIDNRSFDVFLPAFRR